VEIPNYTRYWVTSNEERVVFVDKDDRRFFIVKAGAQHVGDKEGYFDPMLAEIVGDGPAALMRDLMALDISDVALNLPPRTDAFGEQVAANLEQDGKWWLEVLETGKFPQREHYDGAQPTPEELAKWNTEGLTILKETVFDSFNSRVSPYGGGVTDPRKIGKFLTENVKGLKAHRATLQNGARPWCYSFPPLSKLREDYTRETKIRLGDDESGELVVTAELLSDPFFGLGYVWEADSVFDRTFGVYDGPAHDERDYFLSALNQWGGESPADKAKLASIRNASPEQKKAWAATYAAVLQRCRNAAMPR
jgi:hypothetical protein